MSIDDPLFQATDSLIQKSIQKFYPQKIPNRHNQLRHYISTAEPDCIYFATRDKIYSFHIPTRKRELVVSLPFEPRCLVAGFGWVGVGGTDNGLCAFVDISSGSTGNDQASSSAAEVDALLPIDLDPETRRQTLSILSERRSPLPSNRREPKIQIQEHGGHIVNSVTIHHFPGNNEKGLDDETVAVLTNNDHSIRIHSLTQFRVIETILHPVAMNYAVISPDGSILAAVGDENRAYFYRRIKQTYKWHLISSPFLPPVERREDRQEENAECCFAIAFSPAGHICAVACQGGIVTFFDTNLIQTVENGQEAIIRTFKSSRPVLGAVRSMCFSPQPWDLFVWAEDFGRACVIDLRDDCRHQQILELDSKATDVEYVQMLDPDDYVPPELRELHELNEEIRFIRQYREARDTQDGDAAINFVADYIEASAARRRLERHREQGVRQESPRESSPHDLTEQERQIIEALRTSGERSNISSRVEVPDQIPRSIHYLPPPNTRRTPSDLSNRDDISTSSISTPLRLNSTIRDFIRDRNLERTRNERYEPRRRSSVMLPSGAPSSIWSQVSRMDTSSPGLSSTRIESRNEPSEAPQSSSQAWRLIEAAMRNESLPDPGTRLRLEREAAAVEELRVLEQINQRRLGMTVQDQDYQQQRRLLAAAELEAERRARTRQIYDRNYIRPELEIVRRHHQDTNTETGVGTAGIGFSRDGRLLYVGTEEGIFEYQVNIQGRRTFPSLSLR
ncbi:MAG: hypothetical protein M1834_006685 [Cirrosporium novae-zelandiae]|nr:MAG: hypothetical protein M1834_006685 [Cirrosporium novae-zelandiae]